MDITLGFDFPAIAQMPRSLFAFGPHAMAGHGGPIQILDPQTRSGAWYLPDAHMLAQLPGGQISDPWR